MKKIALTFAALCGLATPAHAQDYLTGSVGYYDALRQNYDATQFGVEYRFDEMSYGLRPMVGGFVTTDSGAYGYAGLNWDLPLIPKELYLVPNFAVGLYHDGDGKKLGGPIEFRSGIELDYQFPNSHQMGIALNHISNASIYKHNSGVESVLINYSYPLGR